MIPFIDLAAQQEAIRPQIDSAIQRVLDHGKYIMGPEVAELERALAEYVGSKHCISVSNGTDALIASLMACGIGPGDAVVTTPFTFFATVESIMLVGATPVFADIDETTFNISPTEIEKVVAQARRQDRYRLRAVMPVDLFGLPADYVAINEIARKNDLVVIQDGAQSFGAELAGKRAPTHGDIGTTSFFPAKPLGCYGDGGAIFTDDDAFAETIRSIRVHGKGSDKYDNVRVGKNMRLDTIQAAILIEKLKIYPSEFDARQEIAAAYSRELNVRCGSRAVANPPVVPSDCRSAWAQYTVRSNDPSGVMEHLHHAGVPTVVYYRKPSHLLAACSHLGHGPGDFPVAERASQTVFSLPFHPYLSTEAVATIATYLAGYQDEMVAA